ncbi:glycosyltransferase [Sphingomonas metalli]|uniref:glycosyltransferase n=1 Tax=Sphingomonas metalli TaxID=1779358 RepID=UPI001E5F361C|nr:glycosyltransferase [Sphingomonas metalli]
MTESRAGVVPVAICVPARDEAASLPGLFAALELLDRRDVSPVLCLLLDSCEDASADVVRDYGARASLPVMVEHMVQPGANAGRARHAAMLLGLSALGGEGLLLSTDADSTPAPDWLQAMVAGARRADIVAGKVVRTVTRPNPLQDRIERYYEALHAIRRVLDPVAWEATTSHHHASGANLGLPTAAYRTLGGFLPLSHGEDARLVDDAARAGLRVRRDAASVVHTSDRRLGRVAQGLAGALRALDRDSDAIAVAHPEDVAWQYRRHAEARHAFAGGDYPSLAAAIGLTTDHVRGVARDCANAEAFAMCVVPTPPAGMRQVTLAEAEAALASMAAGRRAA